MHASPPRVYAQNKATKVCAAAAGTTPHGFVRAPQPQPGRNKAMRKGDNSSTAEEEASHMEHTSFRVLEVRVRSAVVLACDLTLTRPKPSAYWAWAVCSAQPAHVDTGFKIGKAPTGLFARTDTAVHPSRRHSTQHGCQVLQAMIVARVASQPWLIAPHD